MMPTPGSSLSPPAGGRQCGEIVKLGQEVQFYTARLLRTVSQLSLYRDMMFLSLGHYAKERLGMSRRRAYEMVWLGRRFIELPELGKAFREGGLTAEQASLIAGVVDEKTVGEWIGRARTMPVMALREEAGRIRRLVELDENLPCKARLVPGYGLEASGESPAAGESPDPGEAQMCAAGKTGTIRLSFFLPHDLRPLWDEALSRFLAGMGGGASGPSGENVTALFLEALLDHFLDTWLTLTKKERHHRVLHRDGFRCQIPGCSSRRNL